ncbi:hypothetical protein DX933_00260 [Ornithinibacillus gellani]|uniref:anti-sigma-I factor RsgI family protein n=1 Tax=Ornithinibacillus gellani TaxID=2293253 RepID=UPI000F477ABA|nr:hypothetical protein [Ornithinibacillus gellani]TQS76575.1 hypothetical protein DX933_00260 [Ornithinibacillus gellani]
MNKGIIMEKYRNYYIVMTHDGLFEKAIPIKDKDIGAEVEFEPYEQPAFSFSFGSWKLATQMIAVVCTFLVIGIPFFLLGNNHEAYAYVNVDINPSLELKLDKHLQVSSIEALNDDAEELLQHFPDYKGKKVAKVIQDIMKQSESHGFLENGKQAVVGINSSDKHERTVQEAIEHYFEEKRIDWDIITLLIPSDIRQDALEKNKSMNSMMAEVIMEKQIKNVNDFNDKELAIIQTFYENENKQYAAINKKDAEKVLTGNSDIQNESPKSSGMNKKITGETNIPAGSKVKIKPVQPKKDENKSHATKKKQQDNKKNAPQHQNGKKDQHTKQNPNTKKADHHGHSVDKKNGNKHVNQDKKAKEKKKKEQEKKKKEREKKKKEQQKKKKEQQKKKKEQQKKKKEQQKKKQHYKKKDQKNKQNHIHNDRNKQPQNGKHKKDKEKNKQKHTHGKKKGNNGHGHGKGKHHNKHRP